MRFSEVAARMTGFSTPVFGVSFEPATSDVAVAREILIYLEDRRVLYAPDEAEVVEHCVISVLDIRRFFTEVLGRGGIGRDLADHLRAMRTAGRRFLTGRGVDMDDEEDRLWLPRMDRGRHQSGFDDWNFNQALGVLRATFGIHIGQIAAKYGIDLEDDLASILPAKAE